MDRYPLVGQRLLWLPPPQRQMRKQAQAAPAAQANFPGWVTPTVFCAGRCNEVASRGMHGGRYWIRTSDLYDVNVAL